MKPLNPRPRKSRGDDAPRLSFGVSFLLALLLGFGSLCPAFAEGPPWARAWDPLSRQAYLRGVDGDADGLHDDEESLGSILWGAVDGAEATWFNRPGSGVVDCTWCSDDDAAGDVALPFEFPWQTQRWSRVWIVANGTLGFGGGQTALAPRDLPSAEVGQTPFFAVFWQHLQVVPAAGGQVWTAPRPGGGFVICWENLKLAGMPGSRVSMQAELRADGEMTWRYRDLDDGTGQVPAGIVGAQRHGPGWSLPGAALSAPLALRVAAVPWLSPFLADSDEDGVPDGVEFFYHRPAGTPGRWLDPAVADNPGDIDRDGLDVVAEYLHGGLDPFFWDTDGDMLGDGYEASVQLLPNIGTGIHGRDGDPDGDGLTNYEERFHRTRPRVADTDADGHSDSVDVSAGANPAGVGGARSTQWLAPVVLTLGDPALDGATEAYEMRLEPISGDTRGFTFQNSIYGAMQAKGANLAIGARYAVTIDHLGSMPVTEGVADPDYEARVEGVSGTVLSIADPQSLLGRHLSSVAYPLGSPPLDASRQATVWVQSRVMPDGTTPIVDPALATQVDAWAAGRGATTPAVAHAQLANPGVLVLPPFSASVVGTVLPTKIRFHGIENLPGMTRWMRFSDPSRISYKTAAMSYFDIAYQSEIAIPGPASSAADVEILARGTWPAGASVLVDYVLRDAGGQVVAVQNRVRLIGMAVAPVGDSITYGYRRRRDGTAEMPHWGNPWLTYPSPSSWDGYYGYWGDIAFQGYRGYLQHDLTSYIRWAGHPANGHGPDHCGYPGAKTGHVNDALSDPVRTYPATAVKTGPSELVVIYCIGLNDVNAGSSASSMYASWQQGLDAILAMRSGHGRTLVVGVTLPAMRSDYGLYSDEHQQQLFGLNNRIRSHGVSAPYTRYVVADIQNVPHDFDDDGLHFMAPGYERIEQIIRQAIFTGLRASP